MSRGKGAMMRKRDLVAANERLVAEVSYLRGRVEELEGESARVVGHVRGIVADTLGMFNPPAPDPTPPIPDPYSDTGDWTDQLAPSRAMTAEDLESIERDWNDGLVIADELDRDP